MTVTVKKIGGSVGVLIPKAVAEDLELREGTALEISSSGDQILMRRKGRRPRRSLINIVKQMDSAAYKRHNRKLLNESRVGKEIW